MEILGVKIDNFSREEALKKIADFLSEEKFHQIATINPEFVLEAQKNEKFKNILNSCDLNVADGIGIKLAFWRKGKKLKNRFAGADLMQEILKMADEKNLSIFLAANKDGLSLWEETARAINKIYPQLKISGTDLNKNNYGCELRVAGCEIVLCNYGAPFQEEFIHSLVNIKSDKPPHLFFDKIIQSNNSEYINGNLIKNNSLPSKRCGGKIRLAMGVGGSFDFMIEKRKRAPIFMRNMGLELLYRLIQQPSRIKRIFNATIIFPIKIILVNKEYNNE